MPRDIVMAASLPAEPGTLFDMYLDATAHTAFTGSPVSIGRTPGSPFEAFGGMLRGRILYAEQNTIVQTWRSGHFPAEAPDSILVLVFLPEGDGSGRVELHHIGVADEDFAGVSQGWQKFYWTPWRDYLEKQRAVR